MPRDTDEPTVSVRRIPAATTRASDPLRWEVTYGSQAIGWVVIGWVEERRLRDARKPVYFATAVHPATRKVYHLEGNTDFDERVNTMTSTRTR